jgi:hypothetical protein
MAAAAERQEMLDIVKVGGMRIATFEDCIITTWSGDAELVQFTSLEDFTLTFAAGCAHGITLLVVVEPGTPFLDSSQRRQAEGYYERFQPILRAVAHVVEGGNLWSVTARSVMTAMRLVQRRPYPIKVFSDVAEGAEWLGPHIKTKSGEKLVGAEAGNALLRTVVNVRGRT